MIELRHDGRLTISTGESRKTRVWKVKKPLWSELAAKLSQTKRTNETQSEYFNLVKTRQDEIKDVGGFVGGELENGKRTALTTKNRTVITLDADFAEQNLWDKVKNVFDNAVCVYSTHKHKPDSPRLRLVIPLNRPVMPDEYQAISRKVAEKFGIDNFDDTTYQPHRLMYYPSTSIDAEFIFNVQDGEFLNADKILAEYDNWQDQSTWARSSRSTENIRHELKKVQDPLTKTGIIGAFCRAYPISVAISTFLSDVYEECGENRYTYLAGSSAGGAVTYEDKWLYSFHATDPCSLQLCNAFDLVRIHKFGKLDEGKLTSDVTKLPSYNAALDFCSKDERTVIVSTKEDFEEVNGDFAVIEESDKWRKDLQVNEKTRKVLPTRKNIRLILENDPKLKGCLGYDLFSQRIAVTGPLSWRNKNSTSKYWEDSDDAQLRFYFESSYGIDSSKKLDDEVVSVAHNNSFHKIRDYLSSLVWDGVKRLDTFFIDYLGAADTEYVRAVTRKMLIAAVDRVMRPGSKWDNMLVLVGPQGIGKSELLAHLGKEWFSDSLNDLQGKDAYEQLRGYWIIEMSELDAFKKAEVSTIKKFLSKRVDSFRVSYGKRTQDFPRQCVFFGTTNEKAFLKDPTGNRRFFPVTVNKNRATKAIFGNENLDADIDQVWAEAVQAWNNKEDPWLSPNIEIMAAVEQRKHTEENSLSGMLRAYLDKEIPRDWYTRGRNYRVQYIQSNGDFTAVDEVPLMKRTRVCTAEIWCEMMNGDIKRLMPMENKKITTALSTMDDWVESEDKFHFGVDYGWQKAFVRKTVDDDDIFN